MDVLIFTSSPQVDRLFEVARGSESLLETGLKRVRVAAVGPVVAQTLEAKGRKPDICPEQGWVMKNLVQHIKQTSNDLLQVEEGSLYPALQRLLKDGLLRADWEISPSKRRVRTYRITPAGKKRLEREVSAFERMLEGITLVISPARS